MKKIGYTETGVIVEMTVAQFGAMDELVKAFQPPPAVAPFTTFTLTGSTRPQVAPLNAAVVKAVTKAQSRKAAPTVYGFLVPAWKLCVQVLTDKPQSVAEVHAAVAKIAPDRKINPKHTGQHLCYAAKQGLATNSGKGLYVAAKKASAPAPVVEPVINREARLEAIKAAAGRVGITTKGAQ